MKETDNSRRSFIKHAALAAAGFMIVPRHVLGGPGFVAPSDKLMIAGIGVGVKDKVILPLSIRAEKLKLLFSVM